MALARRLDGLSFFTKSDLKSVMLIAGFDMTGVGGNFSIAMAPEGVSLLTAAVGTIGMIEDEDGVPLSMVQIFAPNSVVQSAKAAIAAADPGANVPLYYEFRVDRLPGDLGSSAETTLFYGTGPMKGSV